MASPYYGMKILVAAASDRANTVCLSAESYAQKRLLQLELLNTILIACEPLREKSLSSAAG